jgi:hypothetical protein
MLALLRRLEDGPALVRKNHNLLAKGLEMLPQDFPKHRQLLQAIVDLEQVTDDNS